MKYISNLMRNPHKKNRVLISDRNPNIRKLLYRELKAEGYDVILATNGDDIVRYLKEQGHFALLILDPEIISNRPGPVMEMIERQYQNSPIIIHAFHENGLSQLVFKNGILIEKDGNSIERIKQYSMDLLKE